MSDFQQGYNTAREHAIEGIIDLQNEVNYRQRRGDTYRRRCLALRAQLRRQREHYQGNREHFVGLADTLAAKNDALKAQLAAAQELAELRHAERDRAEKARATAVRVANQMYQELEAARVALQQVLAIVEENYGGEMWYAAEVQERAIPILKRALEGRE